MRIENCDNNLKKKNPRQQGHISILNHVYVLHKQEKPKLKNGPSQPPPTVEKKNANTVIQTLINCNSNTNKLIIQNYY